MSNYQNVADVNAPYQKNPESQTYEEIDLIDVIGFFWRSRVLVGSGVILGLLAAATLWFIKRPSAAGAIPVSDITFELAAANNEDAGLASLPLQLTSFVKTPDGARALAEGMAAALGSKPWPIDDWASKLQAGNGFLKSIELSDSLILVTLHNPGVSEDEFKQAVPEAMNAVISKFNQNFANMAATLTQETVKAQLRLGLIKVKALQLFDRHVNLSPSLQKTVIEGMMKELAATSKPEAVTFLLAAIPDSEAQKVELVSAYRRSYQDYESLQAQGKALAKTLNLEQVAPISPLGDVKGVRSVNVSVASIGNRLVQKLPVVLTLGLLVGGMLGTFCALLRAFWIGNRQRLEAVFQKH